MRIKCPSCSADFDLLSALQDASGRELVGLLAKLDSSLSIGLVTYLSLFRSPTRALAWDRALRLANEVMALGADRQKLAAGLSKSCDVLREKQHQSSWKPLTNHNYLIRVLADLPAMPAESLIEKPGSHQQPQRTSKMFSTIQALQGLKHHG